MNRTMELYSSTKKRNGRRCRVMQFHSQRNGTSTWYVEVLNKKNQVMTQYTAQYYSAEMSIEAVNSWRGA